jgi:hypothetical protein
LPSLQSRRKSPCTPTQPSSSHLASPEHQPEQSHPDRTALMCLNTRILFKVLLLIGIRSTRLPAPAMPHAPTRAKCRTQSKGLSQLQGRRRTLTGFQRRRTISLGVTKRRPGPQRDLQLGCRSGLQYDVSGRTFQHLDVTNSPTDGLRKIPRLLG